LIEAFNLKAAIEYVLKNAEAAREALTDMPPRSEDELDAVTLHNQVTKLNSNKNQQLILKFFVRSCQFPQQQIFVQL
jgi:tetratricopeptide repeat protein 30